MKKTITIRTSRAKEPSFTLDGAQMRENIKRFPYFLYRFELKAALIEGHERVPYQIQDTDYDNRVHLYGGLISSGTTQRGKKYIQIGCKRFVGENRRKLLAWAKSAK